MWLVIQTDDYLNALAGLPACRCSVHRRPSRRLQAFAPIEVLVEMVAQSDSLMKIKKATMRRQVAYYAD